MKGHVYKITCNGLTYYGSTQQPLKARMWAHRSHYNAYCAGKKPRKCTAHQLFEMGTPVIELLETIDFEDKKDLYRIERKYITENKCINRVFPGRTQKEYMQENPIQREKLKAYLKKYRAEGKDKASLNKYKQKVQCPICLKKMSLRTFKYKHSCYARKEGQTEG